MKAVATGFFLVVTLVYIATLWHQAAWPGSFPAFRGFVRAGSEAGMVGALADWFAVTALFRHPLGLPIPHTSLIKKKKDQVGAQLGDFIRENFLTPDLVERQIREVGVPRRLGDWLAVPSHAERVATEAGAALGKLANLPKDEDVARVMQTWVVDRISEPDWAPIAGKLLSDVLEEGRHRPLMDLVFERAHEWALTSEPIIQKVVSDDSPGWTPRFVRGLVGDKIHRELVEFTARVRYEQDHGLRRAMDRWLVELAEDLSNDPAMIERVEKIKAQLISPESVEHVAMLLWTKTKQTLQDPSGAMQERLVEATLRIGVRLQESPELRRRLDDWLVGSARYLAERFSVEAVAIIGETVKRWDVDDASRKIELNVGKDLQFIRINGTVVGSLAGVVIHALSLIAFGP
ncbi:hypothetical protein HMPREF9336_02342 [Segniliparus rugosus ATCC BAA-974]|uniref:DUF445 domain-containing protein n=2 Tax=Segniliparus rugosus TaxID=286804 RepID=E5XS70_SEGRC|nr:hypothetical protein HMPREF9336_02342 [Segniliparus rugosus ATCC BAA-974]